MFTLPNEGSFYFAENNFQEIFSGYSGVWFTEKKISQGKHFPSIENTPSKVGKMISFLLLSPFISIIFIFIIFYILFLKTNRPTRLELAKGQ